MVIALDNVVFRWARGAPACLDIAHFEVRAGESVFLHGPSGSGKSTLLGLLGGVLAPERGAIRILDAELTRMGSAARDRFRADHVGFIFQQFNLIPYLSVWQNVLLPCRFSRRRRVRAEAAGTTLHEVARRLLDHLDLDEALRHRASTGLSVGQQQRVAAARALIGSPEIVIAYEPTSSLDAARQASFLELLMRECKAAGATLLFVSHDLRLANAFDRRVELSSINAA